MPRPIDPLMLTTVDGEEHALLLTMAGLRRLKQRFGVANLQELVSKDAESACVPILWEAVLNKGAMTEEQFEEKLPAHVEDLFKLVARLLGISFPDPPAPAPTT